MNVQEALLYDDIKRARDQHQKDREEHRRVKNMAAGNGAQPFCSRCGRAWEHRYTRLRSAISWAVATGIVGYLIGHAVH